MIKLKVLVGFCINQGDIKSDTHRSYLVLNLLVSFEYLFCISKMCTLKEL